VVADRGPGIAPRGSDDRVGSTGLGLDIARRTAVGSGGALRTEPRPGGGTLVEVRLPTVPG